MRVKQEARVCRCEELLSESPANCERPEELMGLLQ